MSGNVRECGECTLCCKLLGVDELRKPVNKWCPHCDVGKGCLIYEDRPQSCRDFMCLWKFKKSLPVWMFPAHSKCVLYPNVLGTQLGVLVDPGRPDAWREPRVLRLLTHMSNNMSIIVSNGHSLWAVEPSGPRLIDNDELEMRGIKLYRPTMEKEERRR